MAAAACSWSPRTIEPQQLQRSLLSDRVAFPWQAVAAEAPQHGVRSAAAAGRAVMGIGKAEPGPVPTSLPHPGRSRGGHSPWIGVTMRRCAVIPAAGRGSRLGLDRPKLFAGLGDGLTIWDVLKQKAL